jgi:hypothetical protein
MESGGVGLYPQSASPDKEITTIGATLRGPARQALRRLGTGSDAGPPVLASHKYGEWTQYPLRFLPSKIGLSHTIGKDLTPNSSLFFVHAKVVAGRPVGAVTGLYAHELIKVIRIASRPEFDLRADAV